MSPEGYAIVPAAQSKSAQPVIVQYVAPPNTLCYAPYCTIEGATEILRFHWLLSPLPGLPRNVASVRGLAPPLIVCRRSAAIQR